MTIRTVKFLKAFLLTAILVFESGCGMASNSVPVNKNGETAPKQQTAITKNVEIKKPETKIDDKEKANPVYSYNNGDKYLAKYQNDFSVRQLILVEQSESDNRSATLFLFSKNNHEDWRIALECKAVLGMNGLGKTREGDAKTPIGDFGMVKAFGVKKRFFHLEFFRLSKAAKNVGRKGDIVALETNMRPAGGFTPDLINFSQSVNCYQIWADVMAFDENKQDLTMTKYYAACASRRNGVWYQHSDSEIFAKYRNQLSADGYYPHVLSGAMGDRFFMAKLNTINEVEEFREFVESRL